MFMKKIIILISILCYVNMFSQQILKDILFSLSSEMCVSKISLKKNIKTYDINKDELIFNKKNIIYIESLKVCLYPVNNINGFIIYAVGSKKYIENNLKGCYFNAFDSFILVDENTGNILFFREAFNFGSICFTKKNEIIINVTFNNVIPYIVKLNKKLKPISYVNNKNDSIQIVKVDIFNDRCKKSVKKINNNNSIVLLNYDTLISYLNQPFEDNIYEEDCNEDFSDFIFPFFE